MPESDRDTTMDSWFTTVAAAIAAIRQIHQIHKFNM